MKRYLISVGDGLSQLLNVIVFLSNNPNESISGRCWRQREHWFFGRLGWTINTVFLWFGNVDHCWSAYWTDVRRAEEVCATADKDMSRPA